MHSILTAVATVVEIM